MFGSEFFALFAALIDDLDFSDEEEEDRPKKGDFPRGDRHEEK